MKIGIALRTWDEKGGIGSYTRSIVKTLLNMDRKNEYVLFFNDHSFLGNFSSHENVREILVPNTHKLIWDQISLPRYAQKENVDIIFHAKFSIPLFSQKKTVMVLHGTERFRYKNFHPMSDVLFFKTIYPYYLKRATHILADSERARQDIIEILKINPDNITTIHLAGGDGFRKIDDNEVLQFIREKYHLPKRFIIYVGHIYPGKNVGRLFQAFDQLRKEIDIKLVMVGMKRWKFKEDLKWLDKLGINNDVISLGYVPHDDLIALYNLAEMTVFPSIYECFPAIPIDANACGCPVVTSYTGGTPEAAGDAAVYVNPFDVQDIYAAMLKTLTDETLRQDLIEKGFKNAKRFSWEKTAEKTLSVLESI